MKRALVLYCCGGGSSMGYALAGFDVTGVDIVKKRDYPFKQIKADCLEVLKDLDFLQSFDFIHASPPCQAYSRAALCAWGEKSLTNHLPIVREYLQRSGVPYIIENVAGSPLDSPIILCGSMFGLKVRRHRLFESNLNLICDLKCNHKEQGKPIGVYGTMGDTVKGICSKTGKIVFGGSTANTIEEAREAMGIDWLNWGDLTQAIPPAYTKYLGNQVMRFLNV